MLDFRRHYFTELVGCGLTAPGGDAAAGVDGGGELDRAAFRSTLFGRIVPGTAYAALCADPRLVRFFAFLLGGDVFLHRRKIIRHGRPGESGIGTATQAHYDLLYLRGGTTSVLSAWIPLGDVPVVRGGLTYLAGSHHRVRAEEAAGTLRRPAASITADLPGLAREHGSRWLVTDYAAGDIVVHDAFMVHASLDNADPRSVIRLSTDIRYQRADAAIDRRWQNHWHDEDGL